MSRTDRGSGVITNAFQQSGRVRAEGKEVISNTAFVDIDKDGSLMGKFFLNTSEAQRNPGGLDDCTRINSIVSPLESKW